MMSVDLVARRAYEAWRQARARTFPVPWERLESEDRAAWVHAVQAVREAIEEV